VRLSKFFMPVLKENPSEAKVLSHTLMLRAGMIRQLSSGLYNFLPLAVMVMDKIKSIVKKNLDESGCLEIITPSIQPASLWVESGRYDGYGKEMLRMKDRHDNDLLYSPTAEEVITDIMRNNSFSYRDYPKTLYQTTWKFRDEIRPRFGLMRGREFLMNDSYSFDLDQASAEKSYKNIFSTYIKIFREIGVTAVPVAADNGVIGGDLSHEFHILASTGESEVFLDRRFLTAMEKTGDYDDLKHFYSAADEKADKNKHQELGENLISARGIEVGHIFNFGEKYSRSMNLQVVLADGSKTYPNMGSYGIGISRVMAAVIESSHDNRGIIWPASIAPFDVIVINLRHDDVKCVEVAENIYNQMKVNKSVLYDDTNQSAGAKMATADLIGVPWQLIIGPKNLANNLVELKNRKTGEVRLVNLEEITKVL
jgi:prolyl-tRNA synthetase